MRPAIRGSTAICPRTPTAQPLLKPDYLRMVTRRPRAWHPVRRHWSYQIHMARGKRALATRTTWLPRMVMRPKTTKTGLQNVVAWTNHSPIPAVALMTAMLPWAILRRRAVPHPVVTVCSSMPVQQVSTQLPLFSAVPLLKRHVNIRGRLCPSSSCPSTLHPRTSSLFRRSQRHICCQQHIPNANSASVTAVRATPIWPNSGCSTA